MNLSQLSTSSLLLEEPLRIHFSPSNVHNNKVLLWSDNDKRPHNKKSYLKDASEQSTPSLHPSRCRTQSLPIKKHPRSSKDQLPSYQLRLRDSEDKNSPDEPNTPAPVAPAAEGHENTVLVAQTQETDTSSTSEPHKEGKKFNGVT